MNILCIGDVCGSAGCEFLRQKLPAFKKLKAIDMVVVNAENSADGNGLLPASAAHLLDSGADLLTGGNHSFQRREAMSYYDENDRVLRPANYPAGAPGTGMALVDFGYVQAAVISLMGTVYMDPLESPFTTADRLVEEAKATGARIILVDFHAEATAEKRGLGFYLDGRISALFGTHTHVQTADEQILPCGTGYITDLGMTGPIQSVLGVKPQLAVAKMKTHLPVRFENAPGPCMLNGCIFTVDHKTGLCTGTERVNFS
ncbi:MAG: YmdB family metallophosphoesterase [Clostridiales bacterium]|nr:YmdB family metallophosphoesterase [Clostridiales bacterium]